MVETTDTDSYATGPTGDHHDWEQGGTKGLRLVGGVMSSRDISKKALLTV
jgi:hypothetical protein